LLLASAGCAGASAKPAPSTDAVAVARAIDSLDANAMRQIREGHPDSLAEAYFSADAIVMDPAHDPPAKGHDAIRAAFGGFSQAGVLRLRWTRASLYVADSLASDQGTYTMELRAKPPADTTKLLASDHGSYVTTFIRRDGEWRAVYDIATSEVPVAPTAASATKH
jgi:ketosteroid isomerase-like protein